METTNQQPAGLTLARFARAGRVAQTSGVSMSKFETAVVEAQIFFGEGDTGSALACLATAKRAIMDWNGFLRIGETPERLAWVQALAEVVNQSRIAKGYKTLRL